MMQPMSRWVAVLPECELVAGKAVRGWAGETRVVVGQLPDGGCFAALDVCPHLDLPLAAFGPVPIERERLVCPWHLWEFDIRSGRCEYASYYADDEIFFFQLRGADRPEGDVAGRLRPLPARARHGMVEVDVSALSSPDPQERGAVPSCAGRQAAVHAAAPSITNHEE